MEKYEENKKKVSWFKFKKDLEGKNWTADLKNFSGICLLFHYGL